MLGCLSKGSILSFARKLWSKSYFPMFFCKLSWFWLSCQAAGPYQERCLLASDIAFQNKLCEEKLLLVHNHTTRFTIMTLYHSLHVKHRRQIHGGGLLEQKTFQAKLTWAMQIIKMMKDDAMMKKIKIRMMMMMMRWWEWCEWLFLFRWCESVAWVGTRTVMMMTVG